MRQRRLLSTDPLALPEALMDFTKVLCSTTIPLGGFLPPRDFLALCLKEHFIPKLILPQEEKRHLKMLPFRQLPDHLIEMAQEYFAEFLKAEGAKLLRKDQPPGKTP